MSMLFDYNDKDGKVFRRIFWGSDTFQSRQIDTEVVERNLQPINPYLFQYYILFSIRHKFI